MSVLPNDFLTLVQEQLQSTEAYHHFLNHCQRPLRKSLRVNTLKISVSDCKALLEAHGWSLTPIPWCEAGFWFERPDTETTAIGNTLEHLTGLIYIQEASSMLPVSALFHQQKAPLNIVLDAAAAPGSKTTQIAAHMNNQGLVIANELSASRLKGLFSNVQRCGITNTALTHASAAIFGEALPETFDAILLDAPCSGEGTLRKDKDAMKNWSLDHVNSIANLQQELLVSAFQALKVGGSLIYSTCTLNTIENQQVCHTLKAQYADAVLFEDLRDLFETADQCATPEGFLHIWPQTYNTEGFFVAKITKTQSVESPKQRRNKLGNFPFTPLSNKQHKILETHIKKQFDCTLDGTFYSRDQEIWCFPPTIQPLIGKVKFNRLGYLVATQHKDVLRMSHEWVIAQGIKAEKNHIQLDREQTFNYLRGVDLAIDSSGCSGEIVLSHQGVVLGLGKVVRNKIKNKLPRELTRSEL